MPQRLTVFDPTPDLPFTDDDWFRFYYQGDPENVIAYEVHEYCNHFQCSYRPKEFCKWHPADCDCSIPPCTDPLYDPRTGLPVID